MRIMVGFVFCFLLLYSPASAQSCELDWRRFLFSETLTTSGTRDLSFSTIHIHSNKSILFRDKNSSQSGPGNCIISSKYNNSELSGKDLIGVLIGVTGFVMEACIMDELNPNHACNYLSNLLYRFGEEPYSNQSNRIYQPEYSKKDMRDDLDYLLWIQSLKTN